MQAGIVPFFLIFFLKEIIGARIINLTHETLIPSEEMQMGADYI